MQTKVCVLKGGISPEREVSLKSGEDVEEGLKEAGYAVFNLDTANGRSFLNHNNQYIAVTLQFYIIKKTGLEQRTHSFNGDLGVEGVAHLDGHIIEYRARRQTL